MRINYPDKFSNELKVILEYIAKDNLAAAKRFKKEILERIKTIPDFPYQYRPSVYVEDSNVRDMIYKVYTIVYKIKKDEIKLVSIFNQNLPTIDMIHN